MMTKNFRKKYLWDPREHVFDKRRFTASSWRRRFSPTST